MTPRPPAPSRGSGARTAAADPGGTPSPRPAPEPQPDRDAATLTVISCNLEYGGIDPVTGDDAAARRAIEVLAAAGPDIVLLQEMHVADPYRVRRHLRRFAAGLGMQPVLGPSAALRATTGNHVALLFAPAITITDEWPPPPPAGPRLPWARAEVTIPGILAPVHVHSVHLAARSATRRLTEAELLASWAADAISGGTHVLAGGDWNSVPAAGADALDLAAWQPRLLAQRCTRRPDGTWAPDLRVAGILHDSGLRDLAAILAARAGDEALLAPTAPGLARIDQVHASQSLAACITRYRLLETGSDHRAVAVTLDLSLLTTPQPP